MRSHFIQSNIKKRRRILSKVAATVAVLGSIVSVLGITRGRFLQSQAEALGKPGLGKGIVGAILIFVCQSLLAISVLAGVSWVLGRMNSAKAREFGEWLSWIALVFLAALAAYILLG